MNDRARVADRLGEAIVRFCETRTEFHMSELLEHVRREVGMVAPDSPGRILRDLRQRGRIGVELVSRSASKYRVVRRKHVIVGADHQAEMFAPREYQER